MKTPAEILDLMRGHTGQNPLAFDDLRLKSGMPADELQQLLDAMQTFPAAVVRCRHWKDGVWRDQYWPTGVLPKMSRAAIHRVAATPASRRPPRRDEMKTTPLMETNMSNTADEAKPVESENKPKSLLMLEYMQIYPNCQGGMLREVANAQTVDSYLSGYINRGQVIKEKHGHKDARYRLAEGMIPSEIYVPPNGKKESPQAGLASSHSDSAVAPAAQLKKPEGVDTQVISPGGKTVDEPVAGNASSEAGAEPSFNGMTCWKNPNTFIEITAFPSRENQPAAHRYEAPREFKMGATSERTIVFYGLTAEPIELTVKQTEDLILFCSRSRMVFL